MKLYLYHILTKKILLEIDGVVSYTADQVQTNEGIYGPLAEDCELSSLLDCSETLRADWKRDNPTADIRIEELETLMASLLFGGDAE